jgi:hypothetical protein
VNEHEKIRIIPKTFFHTLLLYDDRNLITAIVLIAPATRIARVACVTTRVSNHFRAGAGGICRRRYSEKTRRSRFQRRAARFTAACASTA